MLSKVIQNQALACDNFEDKEKSYKATQKNCKIQAKKLQR